MTIAEQDQLQADRSLVNAVTGYQADDITAMLNYLDWAGVNYDITQHPSGNFGETFFVHLYRFAMTGKRRRRGIANGVADTLTEALVHAIAKYILWREEQRT